MERSKEDGEIWKYGKKSRVTMGMSNREVKNRRVKGSKRMLC